MATTNLLLDCTCSLKTSANDLGGGETYASPVSFLADKISVTETTQSSDHSTGQDGVEFHRKNKSGWEASIETKHYSSALESAVRSNALGELIVTNSLTGLGISSAKGLIIQASTVFDKPSTFSFQLKSRGSAITWA